MPSTFRIPRAHVTGLYGRLMTAYARRTWGQVPDNAYVLWHHRPVLRSVLAFERSLAKWNRLDRHLKTYAVLASACVSAAGAWTSVTSSPTPRAGRVQGARGAALARVGGVHGAGA